MSIYTTGADLVNAILFAAGEPTDGSSDFANQALSLLNRAYREMCMGGEAFNNDVQQDWLWLRKAPPGVLVLNTVVNAGTVSVTRNSATATLSSAPAASMVGRFFKVDSAPDVYRVLTHTGGSTTLTLDSVYTDDTNTAAAYRLMQFEYDLATDLIRVVGPMRIQRDQRAKVEGVGIAAMEFEWPLTNPQSGTPHLFAYVGEQKVRFNRYGGAAPTDDLIRLEYDYLQIPTDLANSAGSTPLVPLMWRHVLVDMACTYLFTDKNDDRAGAAGAAAKSGLLAMANENERRLTNLSRRFGKIRARQDKVEIMKQPLRTDSGMIIG